MGAREGPDDDDHEGHQQAGHADPLALGLLGAELGAQVEARGQPAGGDPEDGQLQVPGAGGGVGQDAGEVHPVEGVAFDGVMGRQDTHADLHQEEGHGHGKVEGRPALAGGGGRRRDGLGGRERLGGLAGMVPDHEAHTQDQEDHGQDAPEMADGRDAVAHQGLVGPVLGVAGLGAGPTGGGGPGGPEPEVGHALALGLRGNPAGGDGGFLVALHGDAGQLSPGLEVGLGLGSIQFQGIGGYFILIILK